ncbi:MAG: transglycosylase SLT domain-containing protein [Agathobacter sp.]
MKKLVTGIVSILLVICVWCITEPTENEPPIWITESESIIQWKDPDVSVETIAPLQPEVQLQQIETEIEETETEIIEIETEWTNLSYIPVYMQKLCFEIGEEYHIAPELLIAIIERESGGDANAVNPVTGCMGPMQLHPAYADYYLEKAGCSDPFNPEHNIRAGCEILTEKFEQYIDLPLVLMKYHGESKAISRFKSGKYSKYCIEIMERMEEMQEITGG